MYAETPCCLFIDLLVLFLLTLRCAMNSRDQAPRSEGRKERRNGILAFLILGATYGCLFYLIYVEPNAQAGQTVPWEVGYQWVLAPLLTGIVYMAISSIIIVKLYGPDS